MKTVAVIGSGSWGTALAVQLEKAGNRVILWSFKKEEAESIIANNENIEFLPGVKLSPDIEVTYKDEDVSGADMFVFSTPSKFTRNMAQRFKDHVKDGAIIVSVAKGFEEESLLMLSQVIKEVIPQCRVGALSGPSHAEEVGKGMATAVVAAAEDISVAEEIRDTFMTSMFRIYTTTDLIGVEMGGAMKNLIALAAGIADGLGYGDKRHGGNIQAGCCNGRQKGNIFWSFGYRRPYSYLYKRTQQKQARRRAARQGQKP